MPSKFYRPSAEAPIPEITPHGDARRVDHLNLLQRLITGGMCVSAHYLARQYGIQFKPETLRAWARDPHTGSYYDHRRTYAALVRLHQAEAQPAPIVPVRRHMRRFVRSSSKVA
jgi:hypothetical protein